MAVIEGEGGGGGKGVEREGGRGKKEGERVGGLKNIQTYERLKKKTYLNRCLVENKTNCFSFDCSEIRLFVYICIDKKHTLQKFKR